MSKEQRIYSLNLASYLAEKGHKYKLVLDHEKPGKYYFVFDADINEDKNKYKSDNNLHSYLNMFKKIKGEIYQRRMKENQVNCRS